MRKTARFRQETKLIDAALRIAICTLDHVRHEVFPLVPRSDDPLGVLPGKLVPGLDHAEAALQHLGCFANHLLDGADAGPIRDV
jgi:hypothetical protein